MPQQGDMDALAQCHGYGDYGDFMVATCMMGARRRRSPHEQAQFDAELEAERVQREADRKVLAEVRAQELAQAKITARETLDQLYFGPGTTGWWRPENAVKGHARAGIFEVLGEPPKSVAVPILSIFEPMELAIIGAVQSGTVPAHDLPGVAVTDAIKAASRLPPVGPTLIGAACLVPDQPVSVSLDGITWFPLRALYCGLDENIRALVSAPSGVDTISAHEINHVNPSAPLSSWRMVNL